LSLALGLTSQRLIVKARDLPDRFHSVLSDELDPEMKLYQQRAVFDVLLSASSSALAASARAGSQGNVPGPVQPFPGLMASPPPLVRGCAHAVCSAGWAIGAAASLEVLAQLVLAHEAAFEQIAASGFGVSHAASELFECELGVVSLRSRSACDGCAE
jgi:hypothetical protein